MRIFSKSQGTALSEVNVLYEPKSKKEQEEKQEVIPVADGGVTTVENKIVSKNENVHPGLVQKETRAAVIQNDIEDRNSDHYTLIKPMSGIKYKFIVDCKCSWQGRAENIGQANQLAREHKEKHK